MNQKEVKKKPQKKTKKFKPSNLQLETKPRNKSIGEEIKHYKTSKLTVDDIKWGQKLGSGAQGCVKKCEVNGKILACKILPVSEDKQVRKNAMNELRTLFQLKHTNVVPLHDIFCYEECLYLLMEYCDCGSLDKILEITKTMPEFVISKIAKHVLKGLDYIHHNKCVHRDIKPGNILLNKYGDVKIADFGMVGSNQTIYSTYQGTFHFMSPERLRGEVHSFNSDIWSLGLTLGNCAIGKFPMELKEDNPLWEMMMSMQEQQECNLLMDEKDFSVEFYDFIKHCLIIDPKLRPSAEELLEHGFITKYEKSEMSLGRWLDLNYVQVVKKRKQKQNLKHQQETVKTENIKT